MTEQTHDLSTLPFDPRPVLRTLGGAGVDFVLIGGLAGNLLGGATITFDTDVAYARDPANIERLVAALKELGAELRVANAPDEPQPFQLDRRTIENGMNFTFTTRYGDVDVLGEPGGIRSYQELRRDSDELDLGNGLVIRVASLDHLIAMKRHANRPKDRNMLEEYIALADERRRPG